jgi:glycosyltransferase involved in cell wall biosynthesis
MKISVVISAFNEEQKIKNCLESVKWADEIIFIDLESTDKTLEIARQYTSHIFSHKNLGIIEPVRNFSIAKASGDWILLLDADEEIPPSLAEKLQTLSKQEASSNITHIKLPRKNIIFNKWIQHSGWWPDYQIRFFKKRTIHWQDTVHSVPEVTGEGITLSYEQYAIIHHNYENITQFFHRNFEKYAKLEAEALLKNGYIFDIKDIVRFPLREFLSRYFAREGYKDGLHGLILSILMAFYHFAIFAYLWENKNYTEPNENMTKDLKDELKKTKKEVKYWLSTKEINQEKNPLKKTVLKLKRKINI